VVTIGFLNGVSIDVGKIDVLGNDQPQFINGLIGKGLLKRSKVFGVCCAKINTGRRFQMSKISDMRFIRGLLCENQHRETFPNEQNQRYEILIGQSLLFAGCWSAQFWCLGLFPSQRDRV